MLHLPQQRRTGRNSIVIVIALLAVIMGLYLLLIAVAPGIGSPLLTGIATDATAKKLEQKPGEHGDRLYLPQINVDVAIVGGDDESALEKGAWHRNAEQGDPVKGGNFILSAHRFVMSFTPQGTAIKSPFYSIDKLVVGDRIAVDFKGKRYGYEIAKKYSVAPTAVEIEAPSQIAKLTLYSCTLQGSSDGRDVIEARPLSDF